MCQSFMEITYYYPFSHSFRKLFLWIWGNGNAAGYWHNMLVGRINHYGIQTIPLASAQRSYMFWMNENTLFLQMNKEKNKKIFQEIFFQVIARVFFCTGFTLLQKFESSEFSIIQVFSSLLNYIILLEYIYNYWY